ncbi:BRO-N domain-containing protein [Streptomyces vilmorinianum]|uniref:BRO-N domain-containing protein n=1 Tax=Streptomyces vilmorinianum TaxID=3051092 RepID=UPI0010FB380A|nr:Bro-N domain-containing protein [Streptomyces vilmorinianum]
MDEQYGQYGQKKDAIDIGDFVYAATGARVRRLTMPDGTHWFPAVDVAGNLGYANTRDALRSAVSYENATSLGDLARSVGQADGSCNIAGHRLKRSMRMVNLPGLIQLVNGCTKPEAAPFKAWVADVIATVQRDGSYALEPSPVHPGHVMPQAVVDVIVRLEERNMRLDEEFAERAAEHNTLLRETNRNLSRIADSLERLAVPTQRTGRPAAPLMTPQELLASWQADHLAVTGDVHAVAAYLAPALVRGGARYRLEEIARRTGLAVERVQDCVGLLVERGCMRQTGSAADGARIYLLP